jgi:hypothetical protein
LEGIRPRKRLDKTISRREETYDVCESFDPENMVTSAGDVLVMRLRSRAEPPMVAFLKKPIAVVATPPKSPFSYALKALKRS